MEYLHKVTVSELLHRVVVILAFFLLVIHTVKELILSSAN
jgi:hypothetical protein